eukprot:scaffold4223_cov189-Amphora_coffeaeformis.AAC.72
MNHGGSVGLVWSSTVPHNHTLNGENKKVKMIKQLLFIRLSIAWARIYGVGAFAPNLFAHETQTRCVLARPPQASTLRKDSTRRRLIRNRGFLLFSADKEENEKDSAIKALGPSSQESTPGLPLPSSSNSTNISEETASNDSSTLSSSLNPEDFAEASTTVMITREMKRVLIEELGYRRADVDVMRVELAGPIVEKRISCPPQGMPDTWCDTALQTAAVVPSNNGDNSMRKRLENESKYPLKFPFLGISLILLGKGLSDLVITLIKVKINFPGASLTEEFMGIPVLAIDLVAAIAGTSLGVWTWKTMKD